MNEAYEGDYNQQYENKVVKIARQICVARHQADDTDVWRATSRFTLRTV